MLESDHSSGLFQFQRKTAAVTNGGDASAGDAIPNAGDAIPNDDDAIRGASRDDDPSALRSWAAAHHPAPQSPRPD